MSRRSLQPAFLGYRRLFKQIREENRRLREELRSGQLATIEAGALRQVEATLRSGSKPLYVLESSSAARFVFKLGDPALLEAEVAAHKLRELGGRPVIPACIRKVTVEGEARSGLLKPFVEWDTSQELPPDTTRWSELQRHVMLMEHAWEFFLDNLDTNTGQFALLGPRGFPLNIDWDRAFAQAGQSELSRFAKYKGTLPSARTFLYSDYVEGRVDLRLGMLLSEARRIRKLPKRRVAEVLRGYAEARFAEAEEQADFVAGVLARQVHIEQAFRRFARSLMAERKAFSRTRRTDQADVGLQERLIVFRAGLWNRAQLVWHHVSQGAPGRLGRGALKRLRGLRLSMSS